MKQITDREGLNGEQQAVFDSIAGGARGGVRGPHSILLHRAEVAAPLDKLGAYLRYECAIPERQRELAILVVAASWQAEYEWFAHAPLAAKAGIAQEVIDAVGRRETPEFEREDDALVHRFAQELLETKQVSGTTYGLVEGLFGAAAVIDLVALLGYYTTIAMVLNAFEVAPPEALDYPWSNQEGRGPLFP